MKKTRYRGYRSYDYLVPGVDYRVFDLAAQIDRVPSQPVPTSEAQEARVQQLLEQGPVISFHDHPTVIPADAEQLFEYRRHGRDVTGYLGLSRSGLDAIFDNLADGEGQINSLMGWKWDDTLADLGMRLCDIAHQDFLRIVHRRADIAAARENGQLGVILAIESATPIENELDRLDILYGFGIRAVGVTYSEANSLGGGLAEASDGGLSAFGRRAVRRMNQLGILVDCSHAGDRTTLEVIEASTAPISISHAGARALGVGSDLVNLAAPHHRQLHGPLRVLLRTGGHRPRGLRTGHPLRRSRWPAPGGGRTLRVRAVSSQPAPAIRAGGVGRRVGEPRRVLSQHRALAGHPRIPGRRHPEGPGRQHPATARRSLGAETVTGAGPPSNHPGVPGRGRQLREVRP